MIYNGCIEKEKEKCIDNRLGLFYQKGLEFPKNCRAKEDCNFGYFFRKDKPRLIEEKYGKKGERERAKKS